MIERIALRAAARRRSRPRGVVLAGALLAMLAGCESRLVLNAENAEKGLVIVLPGIDGRMPYNEIAEVLGLSLGTVESRLFRARRRLRSLLSQEDPASAVERKDASSTDRKAASSTDRKGRPQ